VVSHCLPSSKHDSWRARCSRGSGIIAVHFGIVHYASQPIALVTRVGDHFVLGGSRHARLDVSSIREVSSSDLHMQIRGTS